MSEEAAWDREYDYHSQDHSHDLPPADIIEETPEQRQPTPEEMAEELGCAVDDLAEVLTSRMADLTESMQRLVKSWNPPKPNREQRRAMKRGGRAPNHAVRVRR